MTRGELKEAALWLAQENSTNRFGHGDYVKNNQLVNERLRAFTREALCLFADNVALTLAIGNPERSLTNTAVVAKRVVWPVDVVINETALLNFEWRRGPVAFHRLVERYPRWRSEDDAEPKHWYRKDATKIGLFPAPVATYTGLNWIAGYVEHDAITVGATLAASVTADATEIDVPVDLEEALKAYVAEGFLHPIKDAEGVAILRQISRPPMEKCKRKALRSHSQGTIVGGGNGSLERTVGY